MDFKPFNAYIVDACRTTRSEKCVVFGVTVREHGQYLATSTPFNVFCRDTWSKPLNFTKTKRLWFQCQDCRRGKKRKTFRRNLGDGFVPVILESSWKRKCVGDAVFQKYLHNASMCQQFLHENVHFATGIFQFFQVTTHVNWALLCAMPWLSAKKSMVPRRLYVEDNHWSTWDGKRPVSGKYCLNDWLIDGWIDGLMDWWIDGLMDWWIDGLMDWWIDGLIDGWIAWLIDWLFWLVHVVSLFPVSIHTGSWMVIKCPMPAEQILVYITVLCVWVNSGLVCLGAHAKNIAMFRIHALMVAMLPFKT